MRVLPTKSLFYNSTPPSQHGLYFDHVVQGELQMLP